MNDARDIQLVPPKEQEPEAIIQITLTAPDKLNLYMTSDDQHLNLRLLHTALGLALQQQGGSNTDRKPRLIIPTTVTQRNGK